MKILFFAHLQKVMGCSQMEWQLHEPITDEEFWRRMLAQHPALEPYRSSLRLAKNLEFAPNGAIFENGDEAALIPPVSGG